jgi:predicted Zn finger-like uncharacterized protein
MVIECPSCHACFRVDPAKIPPGGRSVRCGKCANTFHAAAPPAAPQTLETIGCARAIPRDVAVPIAAAVGIQAAGAEPRAEVPANPVPSAPSEPEIRLSRPPQVASADAAVPPTAPAGDPTWWLTREGGEEATVDRAAMRELIRQGGAPIDPAACGCWSGSHAAGEVPELQRYFRLRPRKRQRRSPAAASCTPPRRPTPVPGCLSIFCGVCVGMKQFGTRKIAWCRRCDDRCIPCGD